MPEWKKAAAVLAFVNRVAGAGRVLWPVQSMAEVLVVAVLRLDMSRQEFSEA